MNAAIKETLFRILDGQIGIYEARGQSLTNATCAILRDLNEAGFAIVPVEPTGAMIDAACKSSVLGDHVSYMHPSDLVAVRKDLANAIRAAIAHAAGTV